MDGRDCKNMGKGSEKNVKENEDQNKKLGKIKQSSETFGTGQKIKKLKKPRTI